MIKQNSWQEVKQSAERFIGFVNSSPSPFHVIDECVKVLNGKGFSELQERDKWTINPGEKYYVTKNQSSIVAFTVGQKYESGHGFSIVGAHSDSPCLKVKPVSKIDKTGFGQVGVECYGGGIWSTWFDRDLTVAGRVIIKKDGKLESKLVHVKRPILRVPHLAIHLQRDINDKFSPNKENHIVPILCTKIGEELAGVASSEEQKASDEQQSGKKCRVDDHHPSIIRILCDEVKCKYEEILDFELCLADTQPATLGGASSEFIFSPRLDNLVNAYCAIQGLVESCDDSLAKDPMIRVAAVYDNEEVGSASAQGAASTWTELILRRISLALDNERTSFERNIARSFLVSADQSHALHPNYAEKHEANLRPAFHKGPVLKYNGNQRYATTAVSASVLRMVAEHAQIPIQEFGVRNDMPCGSTIGPILSAKLGIRTVDVGGPTLSMHSIREMCCTSSIDQCTRLFKNFYVKYPEIEASLVKM